MLIQSRPAAANRVLAVNCATDHWMLLIGEIVVVHGWILDHRCAYSGLALDVSQTRILVI